MERITKKAVMRQRYALAPVNSRVGCLLSVILRILYPNDLESLSFSASAKDELGLSPWGFMSAPNDSDASTPSTYWTYMTGHGAN